MRHFAESPGGRRHRRPLWRFPAAGVCAAGTLVTLATASDPINSSPRDNPSLVVRPSDVAAGKLVQSPEGTIIGTVDEVLPEPGGSQPAYILVATDSGLKAIPYYAIRHLLRDAHLVIDSSMLAAAPPMPDSGDRERGDTSHWKEHADSYWTAYR